MSHITDRIYEKKWGVSITYSEPRVRKDGVSWNDCVKNLDVKRLARELHEMGAGYLLWAVLHNSPHMNVPNATYDAIAGTRPGEICATRDTVLELYEELTKYDIDLYLYFPGNGPRVRGEVTERLGFRYDDAELYDERGLPRPDSENPVLLEKRLNLGFVKKWSSVLGELSVRYGDKVKGYWLDNFLPRLGFDQEFMRYYYDAAKSGNPDAIVAFNKGITPYLKRWYEKEEFTAGEFNEFEFIPSGRFTDGLQNHVFAPLGSTWGKDDARYDNEYMREYIKRVNEAGGVVTVNIKVNADGSLSEPQRKALMLKDI